MCIVYGFRIGGSDDFFCSAISYDGSRHPVTFSLHDSTIITFENKTDKFSDICEVCSYPSSLKLLFVESGAPRPDNASIPCNLPSACECCQTCTSCVHCETDGRIPKACKHGYRDIFQRKKNNKNKFWARRYRKRLEMKGKRTKSWLYGMK
ncbi:uncharacterized protein LOC134686515 [Mytilus trossulus]|uniref:uncharacterized protein LOC134686515 n=1 Tax=Mytilus trossulus TaxID=6551 RepID=UPI0030049225